MLNLCVLLVLSLFTISMETASARTFNVKSVWFKRPYKGPECVVEIVGVDLDAKANREFDYWSKPDVFVKCKHARWERSTQIEGNNLKPRFVWKAKMPLKKKNGFKFSVYDANVIDRNYLMGRAFISSKEASAMMNEKDGGYRVVSLGYGIGEMKVRISNTPKNLKKEKLEKLENN